MLFQQVKRCILLEPLHNNFQPIHTTKIRPLCVDMGGGEGEGEEPIIMHRL
jgi:hypothetical protein